MNTTQVAIPRILFVVQRYGSGVNGGAETLSRELAEHLVGKAEVEVATSCAIEYRERFENDVEPGIETINNVIVRKFKLSQIRSEAEPFSKLDAKAINRTTTSAEELAWLREIGPYSRDLEHFVVDNAYRFDLIVLVTYLYAPTTLLLDKVKHKSVLVPNAHDELPLRARFFDDFFSRARFVACNAEPERLMLIERNGGELESSSVVAMGFETPDLVVEEESELPSRYMLYAGRIQAEKGCDELFEFFLQCYIEL